MADLLSSTDKASFQNSVLDLFDTFSRDIIIHKEPLKKVTQSAPSTPVLPGYKNTSSPTNIEYVPQNATHKAMISYSNSKTENEPQAGITIPRGKIAIKVKSTTKDYINNGKTEKIVVDDKSFKLASTDLVKDHFGLKLYVYILEESG